MSTTLHLESWHGKTAVDCEGEEIGEIASSLQDNNSDGPAWVLVSTGFLGRKHYYAPADGATEVDGALKLAFTKDHITDSPKQGADGTIDESSADQLFSHYDLSAASATEVSDDIKAPAENTLDPGEDVVAANKDAPVTYDEDHEIRDPNKGTRRDAADMVMPEDRLGIRPSIDEKPKGAETPKVEDL